mgnify:CR=1 FL=1
MVTKYLCLWSKPRVTTCLVKPKIQYLSWINGQHEISLWLCDSYEFVIYHNISSLRIQFKFFLRFHHHIFFQVTISVIQPTCSTDHIGLTSTSFSLGLMSRSGILNWSESHPFKPYKKMPFNTSYKVIDRNSTGIHTNTLRSLLTLKKEIRARDH